MIVVLTTQLLSARRVLYNVQARILDFYNKDVTVLVKIHIQSYENIGEDSVRFLKKEIRQPKDSDYITETWNVGFGQISTDQCNLLQRSKKKNVSFALIRKSVH